MCIRDSCCVAPGVIDTDMMAGFGPEERAALAEETPLSRLGTPEEVARAVRCLLYTSRCV